MLQRSRIALVKVKAEGTSENLLNEIRQIIYSLYGAKEISKELYKNIMISVKVNYIKMNAIFISSRNSKTSDHQSLLHYFTDKINFRRQHKYIALSNLGIDYTWKNICHIRTTNLKCQLQHGMKNLNYLMDHILYEIFKFILNTY